MDPFARGDGSQDRGPLTPRSGDAGPPRFEDPEWTSPGSAEPPIGNRPTSEQGDEAVSNPHPAGLGDPPPDWDGYYSYPGQRYVANNPRGDEDRPQYDYPPYGHSPGYRPGYWASSAPAATRRGSRSALVAVAVIACLALLVVGVGGGLRAATYLRGLHHPAQARARGSTRPGGAGRSGAVDLQALAARLDPSIVDITGVKEDATGQTVEDDAGTGVIITRSGEVVTNNHVIAGDDQLQATLADNNTYPIKVLGEDPTDDVALVQIQGASNLHAIPLRSGASATIDEAVAAFGNALGRGGPPSATQGQVTHLDQTITATLDNGSERSETLNGLIEMSAQICPGDSGGILTNAQGDYLGILTAASTPNNGGGYGGGGNGGGGNGGSAQGECSNDGFVIPTAQAIPIVQQIRSGHRTSKVIIGLPGFLGVEVQECTQASTEEGSCQPPAVNGAQITQLVQGGAAEQAGFPPSFVITAIGPTQVTSPNDLTTILEQTSPGQAVEVTWNDGLGGPSQTTTVTLGAGPPA